VGTLLILAAGVFLIGKKELLFSSTYGLRAEFRNVAGLNNAAEVRVGGIHEGTVKRIDLPRRPDGNVTVIMDLEKATRDIIKKDSVASIKSEGLIGDKYVEISFGSNEGQRIKDGDTIASEPPRDIADLIKKTDQILDSAKDAMQNADAIAAKVNQGQGTMGALINDKSVYQQVNAATAQAKAGATAFDENMEALKHNFFLRGFFHKRGYEDAVDLKKHEIPKLPPGRETKRFTYDALQIFDKPDTAKLKNQKALDEAGRFLEANKFGLVVVAAYTGMKGDADKDRELTEARSMVVRDYLVKNFKLDDTRIKTVGFGKTQEAGDNSGLEIMVYPPALTARASH
jgi:phospholipid/cholesterol/gamma-HCH transport system substrate-binding protein